MKPDRTEIYRRRKWLRQENARWPKHPIPLPPDQWPENTARQPVALWRSQDFIIHVFVVSPGLARLTICRSMIDDEGNWLDGISWEELQTLKNQCGFSGKDAVEVYPAAGDEVNVAHMRHLWVMDEPLSFAWRRGCAWPDPPTQPEIQIPNPTEQP